MSPGRSGRKLGPGDPDYRPPGGELMHPPFGEGNLTALKHGATSPRLRDPLAAELVTRALEEVP